MDSIGFPTDLNVNNIPAGIANWKVDIELIIYK